MHTRIATTNGATPMTDPRDRLVGHDRPCHDWHWLECDRRDCPRDGSRHVAEDGWERPRWLCDGHAQEAEAAQRTKEG